MHCKVPSAGLWIAKSTSSKILPCYFNVLNIESLLKMYTFVTDFMTLSHECAI